MKLFSFVIPAYQEQNQISKTINSILSTELKARFEIIVIDDSSTDLTAKVASESGATVYSINVKNRSVARNFGASKASGKWIVFLDADVTLDKKWGEHVLELTKSPLNCVYQGPIIPAGKDNFLLDFRKYYSGEKSDFTYCSFLTPFGIPQLNSACFMIRKDSFHEMGGFDETLLRCEDSDLGYRLFLKGFIFNVVPSMKSNVFWSHGIFSYFIRFYHHGHASKKLDLKWNLNSQKNLLDLMIYSLSTPHPLMMAIIQLLIYLGWTKESFELETNSPKEDFKFEIFLKNYMLPDLLQWKTTYKPGPFTRFVCSNNQTRVYYQDTRGRVHRWDANLALSQLDRHLEEHGDPGGFISLPLV